MTVYGDLSIVASKDLGELGPPQSEPVAFRWYLMYNLARLAPWAAVPLLFLIPRNRNRHASLVLAWFLVVAGLLTAVEAVEADFAPVVNSIGAPALALALLWLFSGGPPAANPARLLVRTAVSFGVAGVAWAAVSSGFDPLAGLGYFAASAVIGGLLLIALGIGLLACRRRCTVARLLGYSFVGFMAVALPLTALAAAFAALGMYMAMEDLEGALVALGGTLAVGGALSVAGWLLTAPLLWLAAGTEHFRERWAADFAWAGRLTVAPTVPPPFVGLPGETV